MKSNKNLMKEIRPMGKALGDISKSFIAVSHSRENYLFDTSHPFHYHDWYELYCLHEGSCTYHIENQSFRVTAGDWVFIPAKLSHKVFYTSAPHARHLIYFSKDYLPEIILTNMGKFIDSPIMSPAPGKLQIEPAAEILNKLIDTYENSNEYSPTLIRCYLAELLIMFLTTPNRTSSHLDKGDVTIKNIIDYITMHYQNNLTLESLADLCDLTPNYLSRKFKASMGMNLVEYIRKVRLYNAKLMLTETNDSIAQIAYKCGFNDSNYFSYIFKQFENISPLKYRKTRS